MTVRYYMYNLFIAPYIYRFYLLIYTTGYICNIYYATGVLGTSRERSGRGVAAGAARMGDRVPRVPARGRGRHVATLRPRRRAATRRLTSTHRRILRAARCCRRSFY